MADDDKKGDKPEKKKKPRKPLYEVKGEAVNRVNPHCPKCGAGYFLAVHKDRKHCGNCKYTEFVKSQ
tara:strand:- start:1360 stop:1560 length:201 start_codon:yes stop_codon:yes gene_type:complete